MTGIEYMNTVCPTTSIGREPNREDVADAFEDGIAEGYKLHWKPSDEQMADLYTMVCECRATDRQLLQDLYYGLRALRGE